MIIAQEIDGMVVRHYSDAGVMLRQIETDTLWPDAVDVLPCQYTYEETNIIIPEPKEVTIEDKAEAYDILMGVSE